MKRGISPLIATVLLIGFVIILAVLIITWAGRLVDREIGNVDKLTFVDIEIKDVFFDEILKIQVQNNEFQKDIHSLVIRVTPKNKDLLKETFEENPPILPKLNSKVFNFSQINECPEKIEVEVIPQIKKEDGEIYSLIGSSEKTTKKIDCNAQPTQFYLDCDLRSEMCIKVPGKGNNHEGCNNIGNPCNIPPGQCKIDQAYWSSTSEGENNPEEDIGIAFEDPAYNILKTTDCTSNDLVDIDIYKCLTEDCSKDLIFEKSFLQQPITNEFIFTAPYPNTHYTFNVKINGGIIKSSNVLHVFPENFIGLCNLDLRAPLGPDRTKEPIVLTFQEIEQECPDIKYAKMSSIRVKEEKGTEIPYQVDDWNTDNIFDTDDELLFVVNIPSSSSKLYQITYSQIEGDPTNYENIYNEQTNEFWYDLNKNEYWGKIHVTGEIVYRQEMPDLEDHDLVNFLGTSPDYEILTNGPIRARLYSEDSGNNGAEYIADVTYDIYPDKEISVISHVQWTSNCPKNREVDRCWYIKIGEIHDKTRINGIGYEMNGGISGGSTTGDIGFWYLDNPFGLAEENLGFYRLNTDIYSYTYGKLVDAGTNYLLNLDPEFKSFWGYRHGYRDPTIDSTEYWQEYDPNLEGKSRTITAWASSKIVSNRYEEERLEATYDNPIEITTIFQ